MRLNYQIQFEDETIFLDMIKTLPNQELLSPQMINKIRKKTKPQDPLNQTKSKIT